MCSGCFQMLLSLDYATAEEEKRLTLARRQADPLETLAPVTDSAAAITAYIALLEHPKFDPSRLGRFRKLFSGGAPVAPAVVERWEKATGVYIHNAYGLTETSPVLTSSASWKPSPPSTWICRPRSYCGAVWPAGCTTSESWRCPSTRSPNRHR